MLRASLSQLFTFPSRRYLPFTVSVRRYSSPPPLPPIAMGKASNSEVKSSPAHPKDEAYLNSVIDKRINLFKAIQDQQTAHLQSIAGDLIKITLPEGPVKEGKKWLTTPFDIAKEISKSLANNALIAQVNGVLWDLTRPLEGDCELKILKFDSDEGRDTFWHSSAHILGQSLEMTYGCKLCIGPCTTRGEVYNTL